MNNGELHGEQGMDATERWLDQVEADPIQSAAVEWLVQFQGPAVSQQEKTAFLDWMDQNPRHVAAFVELFWVSYHTWSASSANRTFVQRLLQQRHTSGRESATRARAWDLRRVGAIAASVALFVSICAGLVSLGMNGWSPEAAHTVLYQTPIGKNRTVVLQDSSRVTLGGRTRVEVTLSKKERTLALQEGEAYFEVAKEPQRSFKVHVGTVDVTAVGTKFNINRSSESSVVTVTEGRVLVTLKGQGSASIPSLYLNAGEQITAARGTVSGVVSVRDLPAVISWPSGRLAFRQRTLRAAIDDVNRYSQKPLVLAPDLGEITVTGTLMINNIGSWVKSLERAFNLTATEEADRIIIARSENGK